MVVVLPTQDKEEFRKRIFGAVKEMYAEVASCPSKEFHFPTGRKACEYVGYPKDELDAIPQMALESFAGVGYPFAAGAIRPGDVVVDVGSGSGTDVINSALKVGSGGKVYGVDMTDEMIRKAGENISTANLSNAAILTANAESLPFPAATVDVVTSNGVLNLVPDKAAAFQEIFRILKPGGKLQLSDIVLASEISEKSRANPQLWAECIVGAIPEEAYLEMLRSVGFSAVGVIHRVDYFDGSSSDSTKKAARQFGASSITVAASKA
jgi:arsenite methyltransferase